MALTNSRTQARLLGRNRR